MKAFFVLGNNALLSYPNQHQILSRHDESGADRHPRDLHDPDRHAVGLHASRATSSASATTSPDSMSWFAAADWCSQRQGRGEARTGELDLPVLDRPRPSHGARRALPLEDDRRASTTHRLAAFGGRTFEEFKSIRCLMPTSRRPGVPQVPQDGLCDAVGQGRALVVDPRRISASIPLPYHRRGTRALAQTIRTWSSRACARIPFFQTGQRNIGVLRRRSALAPEFFIHPEGRRHAKASSTANGPGSRPSYGHVHAKIQAPARHASAAIVRVPHGWWYPRDPR